MPLPAFPPNVRRRPPRPPAAWPRAEVLGLAVLIVGMVVLLAMTIHTGALDVAEGPGLFYRRVDAPYDPCSDGSCDGLRALARVHYVAVALWTVPAVILGWVLVGAGLRDEATTGPAARDRAPSAVTAAWGFAMLNPPAAGLLVGVVAGSGSIPAVVLVAAGAGLLQLLALWSELRGLRVGARMAWWLAGLDVAVLALGLTAALMWSHLRPTAGALGGGPDALLLVAIPLAAAVSVLPLGLAAFRGRHRSATSATAVPILHAVRWRTTGRPERIAVLAVVVLGVWASWPVSIVPPGEPPSGVAFDPDPYAPGPVRDIPPVDDGAKVSTLPEPEPPEMVGLPDCRAEDLSLQVTDWDAAMGKTYAAIVAEGVGTAPCALRGMAQLRLTQGGEPLDLDLRLMEEHRDPAGSGTAYGIRVDPGSRVRAALYWPGYRTAADQRTPQQAGVLLADGTVAPVPSLDPVGGASMVAPFDVVDGAVLEVGRWAAG